ncbi:hypothetical protein [Mycobacterium sp. GA-1841]|uniref:hypothetical protein n=1 Tax=Mycobacterium sp. GA-1841 TaxID=1834154 RepID=UPI0011154AC3|nr:hypothetical protein [Mycobacterium sp. GA-1841]
MIVWVVIVLAAVVVFAGGGYVFYQCRSAQKSELADIPPYMMSQQSFSIDSVSPAARRSSEDALRTFVSDVYPDSAIVGERFFAAKGHIIGDALRHSVDDHLTSVSSYELERQGDNPNFYMVWQRGSRLQRFFSDHRIVAVVSAAPAESDTADEPIYIYGYFELAPR